MKEEPLTRLRPHGQEHVLRFWEELPDDQRASLAGQIDAIDLDLIERLFRERADATDRADAIDRATRPRAFRLGETGPFDADKARQRGQQALRDGTIGVVVVAGGQGSRLGFPHPKGMFPIGPVSGRSLFQVHIEKIRAAGRRYGVQIPLYVMTSPATHEETVAFLNEHDRFGLAAEDLIVFCQGTMPALDAETGRLLLAEKGSLFLSPDGHGGTLAALAKNGCLEHARDRGITQLFYFQVDNPLVRICEPELVGYHLHAESEMSSQVVKKIRGDERVGNIVQIDGRSRVIEYTELPDDAALRRADDGSLYFWAGSIAIHVFDVAFLDRMVNQADALPFHRADKKVPHVGPDGQHVDPDTPNAVKYERFIFDLMPHAKNAVVVEADQAEVFAPVKNKPGDPGGETPETARAAMVGLHARWLVEAGATVEPGTPVEINPLFAMDAGELTTKIEPGLVIQEPTYFA